MTSRKRPSPHRGTTELVATVGELAQGGYGVAIVEEGGERRAVFVRGGAVGDTLRLAVDFGGRPAHGRILRVEAPGPSRVEPACPHTHECGGCAWMHLSPPGQEEAHRRRLSAALPEPWRRVPVAYHPPLEAFGGRSRARLSARASGGRAVVGFREAGSHTTIEVDRCVILRPELDRARLAVAPLLEGARGEGEAEIALGAGGTPVLELRWEGTLPPATFSRLEVAVRGGAWAGARVFVGDTPRPAVVGDPTPWTVGADGEPLALAPGGFAQSSEGSGVLVGRRLVTLAEDALGGSPAAVLELFAGAGTLTVLLARHAGRVVAVESSRASCDAARRNLAARSLSAKVVEGLAEEYPLRRGLDLVVLDPPRTGARRLIEGLALARPRVIAYVSCDVPTLARDLGALGGAYDPVALEAFAMFPQTPHVETIAVLVRSRGAR